MSEPIPCISADSHITEPPGTYADRIDPKFRDRAPRVEFNETRDGQYIYAVCPFVRTPALPRSAFAQACSRAGWDQRDACAAARQLTLDGCGRRTR